MIHLSDALQRIAPAQNCRHVKVLCSRLLDASSSGYLEKLQPTNVFGCTVLL